MNEGYAIADIGSIPDSRPGGVYNGVPYKSGDELEALATDVVKKLSGRCLPIWQAREVLHIADKMLDWEVLGYR